jgi:hypothetical protein
MSWKNDLPAVLSSDHCMKSYSAVFSRGRSTIVQQLQELKKLFAE